MKTCEALVIGSPYSRKGTNQFVPCKHPAKFHVISDYTSTGGKRYEKDVCGLHVKQSRSLQKLFKDGRVVVTGLSKVPHGVCPKCGSPQFDKGCENDECPLFGTFE